MSRNSFEKSIVTVCPRGTVTTWQNRFARLDLEDFVGLEAALFRAASEDDFGDQRVYHLFSPSGASLSVEIDDDYLFLAADADYPQ